MMRDIFSREALAQIPKILTLQDRNPHSPTFGCFDRNFWQYKIIDFPSGMAQEFVFPLALAYHLPIPGNRYYRQEALRQWIDAGMRYAMVSSHRDGSCDDYFPYEKAGGAAAFSLLAFLESATLIETDDSALFAFFALRADWLADHHESGRLANHQALILLCLALAGRLLKSSRWEVAVQQRLDKVLSWQSREGWFYEYEGCDPGYHTLTLACLARFYELQPSAELREALERGVAFAAQLIHPDGSFGGEYTSRNTYNFFPHGFELIGKWMPAALQVNDQFLHGLQEERGACYADDHIVGHHTWSYLLAWRDYVVVRPQPEKRSPGKTLERKWYTEAGLIIDRRGDFAVFLSLTKGGVFKLFHQGKHLLSDTNFSLQVASGGKIRNAVAHLADLYSVTVEEDVLVVEGSLGWAKQKQMTTFNLVVLRLVMGSVGRFFPDLIRKILQRILITGKQPAPFTFRRCLRWHEDQLQIEDQLWASDWKSVKSVGISGHQTSIYVVMSRTFQEGQLQPWQDLTAEVEQLAAGQPLVVQRVYRFEGAR